MRPRSGSAGLSALAACAAVVTGALAAGCASSRSPLAETAARLAEATTPKARVGAVAERLADGGAAPLADGRVRPFPTDVFAWGTPAVVAAFVPGQEPVRRDELVTVAAAVDGPAAAETVEAARRLVAERPHTRPRRTVLVALWPAALAPTEGLARVRAAPVWPDALRTATLVVGAEAPPGAVALDTAGLAGEALVARIVDAALALADAPPPEPTALDTLAIREPAALR